MISFGIILFRQAGALTGGTAGMAFLIHYATHLPFGGFSSPLICPSTGSRPADGRRLHAENLLRGRTGVAVLRPARLLYPCRSPEPYYATLFGNIMVGIGFVVLFRHKASLGGVNILALICRIKAASAPVNSRW